MATGIWRKLGSRAEMARWQPPMGWVCEGGVWQPANYRRSSWELAPVVAETSEQIDAEYVRCLESLKYFVLNYCWTVDVDDPSGVPQFRKFPAYPYLRQFFDDVQPVKNIHVEKTRQMTLSWAWMAVFLWDVLFHERWPDLVISRRSVEVDDGGASSTPDSLLGKVRMMHMHLPHFLWLPFEYKSHHVRNPQLGSYIRGETGTGHAGRGPTYKRALMDEAAYIEGSEAVLKAVRSAAKHGTALNSTPNGKGNAFARVRFNPHSTFAKLSYHWSLHPRKAAGLYCTCGFTTGLNVGTTPLQQYYDHVPMCTNTLKNPPQRPEMRSPWYDEQCLDLTPEGIASELDIGYEKSRRGRVYDTFDGVMHVFDHTAVITKTGEPLGERHVNEPINDYRRRYLEAVLNPRKPCVVTFDFGVSDPTWLALGQIEDEELMTVRWLDGYWARGESFMHYHGFLAGLWMPLVRKCVPAYPDIAFYGDPAGNQRNASLESWVINLALQNPKVHVTIGPREGTVREWLDLIRDLCRHGKVLVSSYATEIIDALEQYHFPVDSRTGEPVEGEHPPVHDQYSHPCDAIRYFYQFRFAHRLNDKLNVGVSLAEMLAVGETATLALGGEQVF